MAMLKKSLTRRKYDVHSISEFLTKITIETEAFVNKVESLMIKNELLLPSECRSQLVDLILFHKKQKLGKDVHI